MNDILIRKARPEDADTIIRFQLRMALETESLVLDPGVVEPGVKSVLSDPSKGFYHLAEHEGKVIACHMVTYEWSDWRNSYIYWIQSLFVEEAYREKGVFRMMYRQLWKMVESDESLAGIRLYVVRQNTRAQKVYSRLGMDGDHYRVFEQMKQ